jgi:hypothetical protein
MGDAKLTPRRLADVLHRLDEIEKHSKAVRQQVIEAMAERRASVGEQQKRRPQLVKR